MKQIPLHNGMVAIVDDEDYEALRTHRWQAMRSRGTWYAVRSVQTRPQTLRMHRIILSAPEGVQVDHKDGNGLNNTRSNLRLASHYQNKLNKVRPKHNTSGYKGVSRRKDRWLAQIKHNKQYYCLGTYDSPIDAAKAYDRKALELHGEFASVNFPKETSRDF